MLRYYSLLERDPETLLWSPQFGDYDLGVVAQEMQDLLDSGTADTDPVYCIISSAPEETAITDHVASMNRPPASTPDLKQDPAQ